MHLGLKTWLALLKFKLSIRNGKECDFESWCWSQMDGFTVLLGFSHSLGFTENGLKSCMAVL